MRPLHARHLAIFWALQYSMPTAMEDIALASPLENSVPSVYINNIRCEGARKTSCEDLISVLSIGPKRTYTDDELNALNIKMKQLGYFSSYSVSLEPLKETNHANLILQVVEKSTVRHSLTGRFVLGNDDSENGKVTGMAPHALYAYSDHNFLGKGYLFQGVIEGKTEGNEPRVSRYSLELAAQLKNALIGSLRVLSSPASKDNALLLFGLGYQLSENSVFTGYVGHTIGCNFTYYTEDNSFIPTTGSLLSLGVFRKNSYVGGESGLAITAADARTHWQIGDWGDYRGILTIGGQFNSQLNPAFRSLADPDKNSPSPESGITYSLVTSGTDGRRSAMYLGIGNSGISDKEYIFTATGGYKASLESIDVSVGVFVVNKGAL